MGPTVSNFCVNRATCQFGPESPFGCCFWPSAFPQRSPLDSQATLVGGRLMRQRQFGMLLGLDLQCDRVVSRVQERLPGEQPCDSHSRCTARCRHWGSMATLAARGRSTDWERCVQSRCSAAARCWRPARCRLRHSGFRRPPPPLAETGPGLRPLCGFASWL